MKRPLATALETEIRWRAAHPLAPSSHDFGISDRVALLGEVDRLRAAQSALQAKLEDLRYRPQQLPLFEVVA